MWLVRLWFYLPMVGVVLGVGYASHHLDAALIAFGGYVAIVVGLAPWARRNRAKVRKRLRDDPGYAARYRERERRVAKALGLWIFGAMAMIVIFVLADIAYRLV